MPATIDIQHEVLTYSAVFERPVLNLWGNGGAIVRGFYEALTPYNVGLRDFQIHSYTPNASEPIVTITVGSAILKFSFGNIDVTFKSLSDDVMRSIPSFLEASTSWLKKAVPDFNFSSHSFVYFQHAFLKGTTIEQLLATINPTKLDLPGVDLGSGAIFNRSIPERFWTTQLTLDKSAGFPGALFLGLSIKIGTGAVEYKKLFAEGMSFYGEVLRTLDLESPYLAGLSKP
jgi:hypothetical protein